MHFRRYSSYKKLISWYSGLVRAKPCEPPFNHIVQIGDPILRTKSEEIPLELIKSGEIQFLITHMKKVMKKFDAVGLAAPQIGLPFRLFLLEFSEKHQQVFNKQEQINKEMTVIPLQVIINPKMKITDYSKISFRETCESVKGFHADVTRYRALTLSALNENCEKIELSLNGWPARIVQHEMDHLDGKLYTDIMNRHSLTCSCWQVINERGGKVELPYGP